MFYGLLSIVLLNIVYLTGFFVLSIFLKVTEAHYFLGFNPRLFTFRIRGIKFSIGPYIPIIGLSRIYTVSNGEKQPIKYPWEFYHLAIAKRLLATFGGAIALLVSGILIYIGVTYFDEKSIITKDEVNRHGIYPSDWAKESGFQRGDRIVSVNGHDYKDFSDLIAPTVLLSPGSYYTVVRDGKEIDIPIKETPGDFPTKGQLFISLLVPFEVAEVAADSPAEQAGIRPGDRITKVNEHPIIKFLDMNDEFQADEDGNIIVEIARKSNDSLKVLRMNVSLGDEKRIGIRPRELINYTVYKNSIGDAIRKGTYGAFNSLFTNILAFAKLINGHVAPKETLSGPIGIAQVKSLFWRLTAMYAIFWAFWNLLPLPRSAFWEAIPLAYEGITRKKYPYSVFRRSTNWAWIFMAGIFIWILIGDIINLLL